HVILHATVTGVQTFALPISAVVGDAGPAIGCDLEDRPDLAGVDQLAGTVPGGVIVTGAIDRELRAMLFAHRDHRVGLGQAESDEIGRAKGGARELARYVVHA